MADPWSYPILIAGGAVGGAAGVTAAAVAPLAADAATLIGATHPGVTEFTIDVVQPIVPSGLKEMLLAIPTLQQLSKLLEI
jgi:hypothetical protein